MFLMFAYANRARCMSRYLLRSLSAALALTFAFMPMSLLIAPRPVHAQSQALPQTPVPRTGNDNAQVKASWIEGLKLLDSAEAADWAAGENMIRQALQNGERSVEAYAVLALLRLRQSDPEDALQWIDQARKSQVLETSESAGVLLRAELCASLTLEDKERSTQAFKDIARRIYAANRIAAQDAKAIDALDLRCSAHTLGITVAMLEPPQAESVLAGRDIQIASQCALGSNVSGVATTYEAAFALANKNVLEITKHLQAIAKHGADKVRADLETKQAELKQLLEEAAQQEQVATEFNRNTREQVDQDSADRRKLTREIRELDAQRANLSPGHPGRLRAAPPLPPPSSSIYVQEYEIRTVYEERVVNGQVIRVPVTREVRRPQYEIDRERNERYSLVMRDYENARREYDAYVANYQNALRTWQEVENRRLKDLDDRKSAASAKVSELDAEKKALESERSAAAKEVVAIRNAREALQFEIKWMQLVLDAVAQQKVGKLFRPDHFPLINWSIEKARLQRNLR